MNSGTVALNECQLSRYLPSEYRGLVIEDANIDGMYDLLHERLDNSDPFFRRIRVSLTSYDATLKGIRLSLIERPDVIIIDNLTNIEVAKAIYDSGHLFHQNDYVLEIANEQYGLVRRDCYK